MSSSSPPIRVRRPRFYRLTRLGWLAVARRIWREGASDRISLVAAGCAFYAMLALFPALSLLISVYGLVFDPTTVEPQLAVLNRFLPEMAQQLITARVHDLVTVERPRLGIGAAISGAIALWSASAGTRGMIGALNLAYEEEERRGFFAFHGMALLMTLAGTLAVAIGIALLVFLPTLVTLFGLPTRQAFLIRGGSMLLLLVLVTAGLAALYRFGPSLQHAKWRKVVPGAVAAALLWAIGSALFSFYVTNYASYDATYGPLGGAIGLMMWLYVTVFVILLGAELNSEFEVQSGLQNKKVDPAKTVGPPS
ncbi:membrane protein [Humitalea rosea]|uniref:Membrane protein n=1 Tax=Humitalea rosea TaxID=990373 RepID=A0A2W7I9T8_9PROT|nr:YihY/virulence factor BrkB family protein [Humitalea rosea]PZW43149.1 membrane protein [Humitalea rosea]